MIPLGVDLEFPHFSLLLSLLFLVSLFVELRVHVSAFRGGHCNVVVSVYGVMRVGVGCVCVELERSFCSKL